LLFSCWDVQRRWVGRKAKECGKYQKILQGKITAKFVTVKTFK